MELGPSTFSYKPFMKKKLAFFWTILSEMEKKFSFHAAKEDLYVCLDKELNRHEPNYRIDDVTENFAGFFFFKTVLKL